LFVGAEEFGGCGEARDDGEVVVVGGIPFVEESLGAFLARRSAAAEVPGVGAEFDGSRGD
jgi:hypothetical protein